MRKYTFTVLCLLFFSSVCYSQIITGIKWSKQFGGNGHDNIFRIVPVANTGWLVFGTSSSTNGDIGVAKGGTDIWITYWNRLGKIVWKRNVGFSSADEFADVMYNSDGTFYVLNKTLSPPYNNFHFFKMNLSGNILFQATYGGSGDDIPKKIIRSPDGLMLVGNSTSTDLPSHHGGTDIYVVKIRLDSLGLTKTWDKCFGGTATDEFFGAETDAVGNAILISESSSANGDVTGGHGRADIWAVSLSPSGVINWQKCYGGSESDFYGSVVKTPDNNFVITSGSASYDGDVTGFHYGGIAVPDAWVFKIDASGNILWKNCFGGTGSETVYGAAQSNGEIYVVTTSNSNNGSVSGNHGGIDIWLFKLGSGGNLIWQRCLGGSKEESFIATGQSVLTMRNPVIADNDGGCVIQGFSASINGDVTGFHGTASSTVQDIWLVKVSNAGTLEWQRCFGGTGREQSGDVLQNGPHDYMFGFSSLSVDGDFSGSFGGQDAFIARLGPANNIKGSVYLDFNHNNVFDSTEIRYPFDIKLQSVKGSDTTIAIANRGRFLIDRDTGSYVTKLVPEYFYLTPTPPFHNSSFATYFNKDSIDFGLQPLSGIKDLYVKIIPLDQARAGFKINFLLLFANIGTDTISNVQLKFIVDQKLNFLSAVPSQTGTSADTLYWNFTTVPPFEGLKMFTINCTVKTPSFVSLSDTIMSQAVTAFNGTDQSPENNTDTLKQVVVGSFDPNDKSEGHAGNLDQSKAQSGEFLDYVIRFQNTGTDTAFNIVIKDTLVEKIDVTSFQMIHSSHPYSMTLEDDKVVTWTFLNINLPDSNKNEAASHGYIAYRVRPKNNVTAGDIITNSASIYFDFNLPVKTNEHKTLINYQQPTITSVSPTSGATGDTVTITGADFTGATAVSFGGVAANSFTVNSSTTITAVIGTGASGDVSLITPGGTATLAGFTFIPAPSIISFTPSGGAMGAVVTITGTNLTGTTTVSFGGVAAASFTVNSPTTITATIGTGATGDISIVAPGGTATIAGFTFISGPTITSFTPVSGGTGTVITITGTDLTGTSAVSFGGTAANSFTVNSTTNITAVVGTGASGSVSVTTPGGTATLAGFAYTVVTAIDPISGNSLGIRLYPNPTSGNLTIDTLKLSDNWETLEIFNSDGKKKLSSYSVKNKTKVSVNLEHLASGFYTAILKRKNGSTAVIKFLKL